MATTKFSDPRGNVPSLVEAQIPVTVWPEEDPFQPQHSEARISAEAKAIEKRTLELDGVGGPVPFGPAEQFLEAAPRRSWLARAIGRLFGAPVPTETEIAVRLLCVWTVNKPEGADEVAQACAVLTARQILALTGGR